MTSVAAFFPGQKLARRQPAAADAPAVPIAIDPTWSEKRRALGRVYNRLGGLIGRLAEQFGVSTPAVLAVWYVESSGREHVPGRAIIRFENHILFDLWGKRNPALYDQHFRHGGRLPATGPECRGPGGAFAAWKCHAYRRHPAEPFGPCHQGQEQEYDVLEVARSLAGDAIACQCISIGGPQIMGFHYERLGFSTPRELFDAFQASEGAQVRGFFSFCEGCGRPGEATDSLRRRDWETFARLYNGSGNVAFYAGAIRSAYEEALRLF